MLKDLDNEQKMNFAFLGRCVKGIAHNINTPLSAIMGRAEMLQMRLNKIKAKDEGPGFSEDFEKCLRDISLIIENSNRVSETVKGAMKKSIFAENNALQKLNLSNILQEELEFFKADMDFKHNIEKSYQFDEKIPSIEGVYMHFSNSFVEIIENCKEAVSKVEEKKLTVSMTFNGSLIEISFNDTGCGIAPEEKKRILGVLNNQPTDGPAGQAGEPGISRIGRLLKPYRAQFEINSRPGDTTLSIKLPVEKNT